MPLKGRRSMPLLPATGPVQERNRDVKTPLQVPMPLSHGGHGVVHVSIPRVRLALVQPAGPAREHAAIFLRTEPTSAGPPTLRRRIVRERMARVKASLRSVGAARP